MPRHLAHAVALACSTAYALACSLALVHDAAGEPTNTGIAGPRGAGVPATDSRTESRTESRTASRTDSLVDFRLGDQFGRVHDAATYRGRSMILVGAGRGGRAAGTAWVETLRDIQDGPAAPTAVPVVAVADLRGVPRLLRRLARGRFPDDPRRAVLLDWTGTVARRLGFDAERCTIVLVAPDGRPGARTSPAAVDTAAARELLRQAAALVPAPTSGSTP